MSTRWPWILAAVLGALQPACGSSGGGKAAGGAAGSDTGGAGGNAGGSGGAKAGGSGGAAGAGGADAGAASGGAGGGGSGGAGGSTADAGAIKTDGPAVDVGGGGADTGGAGSNLTGMYGGQAVKPVMAAYWIGSPTNQAEAANGPFVYAFSGPVTCADISKGSAWLAGLPAGTQMLELIIGTNTPGTTVPAMSAAKAGAVEANYGIAPTAGETRAAAGSVTLVGSAKDVSNDVSVDLTFPAGSVKGTIHAVWCQTGREL